MCVLLANKHTWAVNHHCVDSGEKGQGTADEAKRRVRARFLEEEGSESCTEGQMLG